MLIFAHRGASADAPENTLSAFELAIQQRADGIELDIYQHGSEFVVIHDKWLERTTNGQGSIDDYTFQQLKQLDAGNQQSIPSLQETMEKIAGRCTLNIELKGIKDVALLIEYTEKCCLNFGFDTQQIIFSSFDHHLIQTLKHIAKQFKIAALTACKPLDYAKFAEQLQAYSVNVDVAFLDKNFVDDAHRRGLKVFSYTVNHAADLLQFQRWGVDGVFVNSPAKSREILGYS
jgi:glycerophosphoryl diester phosphodiesterase